MTNDVLSKFVEGQCENWIVNTYLGELYVSQLLNSIKKGIKLVNARPLRERKRQKVPGKDFPFIKKVSL